MEPLHPSIRQALKEAHPGLTDNDIDRYEELLSQRYAYDPEEDGEKIQKLDKVRERLVQEKMPKFREVYQRIFHAGLTKR
jgi:hypothetical protein